MIKNEHQRQEREMNYNLRIQFKLTYTILALIVGLKLAMTYPTFFNVD